MRFRRIVVVSACMAAFPLVASAHPIKGVGDFYAGVLHPLTSLDFVLPMIALGLLAGQQRRESAIAALAAFPISLVVGAASPVVVHFSFTTLPGVAEWLGPALMSMAGFWVALSLRGPTVTVTMLFTVFGFTLGSAQGLEITPAMSAWKFVLGVGCCGLVAMAYGIGLVRKLQRPWTQIAVRVAGSWVATAGLMVLALTESHAPR